MAGFPWRHLIECFWISLTFPSPTFKFLFITEVHDNHMDKTNEPYRSPATMASWRGVYMNDTWHCDCNPRAPAKLFQTKKPGVNHGRWCRFFS